MKREQQGMASAITDVCVTFVVVGGEHAAGKLF